MLPQFPPAILKMSLSRALRFVKCPKETELQVKWLSGQECLLLSESCSCKGT